MGSNIKEEAFGFIPNWPSGFFTLWWVFCSLCVRSCSEPSASFYNWMSISPCPLRPFFVSIESRGQLWAQFLQSWQRSKLMMGLRAVRVACVVRQTLALCTKLYSPCGSPQSAPATNTEAPLRALKSAHGEGDNGPFSVSECCLSKESNTSSLFHWRLKWKFIETRVAQLRREKEKGFDYSSSLLHTTAESVIRSYVCRRSCSFSLLVTVIHIYIHTSSLK